VEGHFADLFPSQIPSIPRPASNANPRMDMDILPSSISGELYFFPSLSDARTALHLLNGHIIFIANFLCISQVNQYFSLSLALHLLATKIGGN
jgi:hypothetical protein